MNRPERRHLSFGTGPLPGGEPVELSQAGERRRAEMLAFLEAALLRRRRWRTCRRWALAAALLVALGWMVEALRSPPRPFAPRAELASRAHEAQEEQGPPRVRVEIVRQPPGALERLAAERRPLAARRLSDAELLELLRAANRPDGLIRSGSLVLLASETLSARGRGPGRHEEGSPRHSDPPRPPRHGS